MIELYRVVREKLSILDNMYDVMRIIDPINKNIINISNQRALIENTKCYDFFKRGTMCDNCISKRAHIENDTFIKLEYVSSGVILIIATPVITSNGKRYIVEIIKNIASQNNRLLNDNLQGYVKDVIYNLNEKVIRDELTDLKRRISEEDKKRIEEINKEEKLSSLNYRIQELRNILNEMNISSDDKYGYKETLKISQDLDELIVEYMKNVI
jgi:two-component system, cell cycle response regulator